MKLSSINSVYSLSINRAKQASLQKTVQKSAVPNKKKKFARGITIAASTISLVALFALLLKPDKTSQKIKEAIGYIKKDSKEVIDKSKSLFEEVEDLLNRKTNDTFENAEIPASIINPRFSTINDKFKQYHLLSYLKPDNSKIDVMMDETLKIKYIKSKAPQNVFFESFLFDDNTISSCGRHYTKTGMPDNRSDNFLFKNGILATFKKGFKKDNDNNISPEKLYLFNKKGICTYHTITPMAPNGKPCEAQSFRRTIFGNYKDTTFNEAVEFNNDYFQDTVTILTNYMLDFLS